MCRYPRRRRGQKNEIRQTENIVGGKLGGGEQAAGDEVAQHAEHRAAEERGRNDHDGLGRVQKALGEMGHGDAHEGDRPGKGRDAGRENAGEQDQLHPEPAAQFSAKRQLSEVL